MSLRKFLFLSAVQPLLAVPFAPASKPLFLSRDTNNTVGNATQTSNGTASSSTPTPTHSMPPLPVATWALKNCSDPAVGDQSLDPITRWSAVDARNALSAANNAWNNDPVPSGHISLPYPEYISDFFDGPEQWNCQDVGNTACSTTLSCSATKIPAGYFILNSFAHLHSLHQEIYTAIGNAQQDLQSKIGQFTSTFTTKFQDDSEFISILLNVLGLSFGLGNAYFWNRIAPVVLNGITQATRNAMKDTMKSAIKYGTKQASSKASAAKDSLGSQNNLNAAMGVYFQTWRDSISDYVNQIFSGQAGSLGDLGTLIGSGGFNYNTGGPNLNQLQQRTEAIVTAQLIATAWRTNPAKQLYPMIMETDIDCGASSKVPKDMDGFMSDDVAAQTHVCYNNHVYYLVQAVYRRQQRCAKECLPDKSDGDFFQALPGGTNSNLPGSTDAWSGVKVDNFVISSVDAWNANGNKNGYSVPDDAEYAADLSDADANDLDAHFETVLQTPGIYQIPVCKIGDLGNIVSQIGGDKGNPNGDWWPCNP